MPQDAGWGVRGIRQRCRAYREVLEASPELCTPEELNDYWPGGRENQLPSPGCWVYCFGIYLGMLRGLKDDGLSEEREAAAHAAAMAAFREKPVVVELVAMTNEGRPTAVTVYPKSYDAIAYVEELDGDAHWLLDKIKQFEQRWSAQDQLHRREALRQVTEIQLRQCWIATTPGAGMPFVPGDTDPTLPAHCREWATIDLVNILKGYTEVNRTRIELMTSYLRPRGGQGKALSFAVLGVAATKAAGGGSAEDLFRRRSFGGWFAQAVLTWEAEREAQEEGERRQRAATSSAPAMLG